MKRGTHRHWKGKVTRNTNRSSTDMSVIGLNTFRLYGLLIAFVFVVISFNSLFAQCDLSFKYKVEHTSEGKSNGKISMQLESGDGPYTIKIFDLKGTSGEFLETKEFSTFSSVNYRVVFDKLKPSEYLIRIENSQCKKSLTGIEGIQIK